ncbi:MAG TPA: hypothetical protein VII09_10755 [Opitutaceae bacterium]
MNSSSKAAWPRGLIGATFLFVLFLGLLASRRWEQFKSPQVWCEDGRIISGFIANGWREFLLPVNGYLILVPKIITRASLAISTFYYPIVSTVLACLFSAGVGLAVAFSPTRLRGRVACALSLFLVPSDAEVFGLPLYTLWWAPILLLLLALWDERRSCLGLRLLFVAAGGLSSPFILVVWPVLCLRALWLRRRGAETAVALAATLVSAVQVKFILGGAHMELPPGSSFLAYVVPKFCGWFLLGNFSEASAVLWPAGFLVMAVIAAFWIEGRRSPTAWILVYLYCGGVASSIFRNDPAALHPIRGGPRYFFFPFILTFWILIQLLLATEIKWLRISLGTALAVAVLNALPAWTRYHDDLHWAEHLASARLFSEYEIPIESDGHRFRAWSIDEPGRTWNRLLREDGSVSPEKLATLPTFAYRVVKESDADTGWGSAASTGAYAARDETAPGRERLFKLSAGSRLRFRSGRVTRSQSMQILGYESVFLPDLPITTDWVTLEFSNSRLPREFTVKVDDHGQGLGEWSESARN